ncbi:MAG: hypothetical protein ACREIP_04565 [Alphaproteobacteria bacterium]
MWRTFTAIIAAMAVVGLLGWLAARQAPRKGNGIRSLTWPPGMQILTLALLVASFGVAWMAAQARPSQAVMATLVAGGFVIGAVYLNYSVFLYRVWWTKEGVGSWHPLGGHRFIRWDEVESGRYVTWVQAFVIHGAGKRIWYSPMHAGIGHLHRMIGHRLKPLMTKGGDRPYLDETR